ncbi:methyltransferase domain-containing protein [Methylomagnum sp.]
MKPNRQREPEEMDDPALPAEAHRLALAGLARLNRISFSTRSIWNALERAGAFRQTTRILDLATGGGDLPIALARRARHHGIALHSIGADRSAFALRSAQQKARAAGLAIEWRQLDATADPLPACDWITCSLFLHHLDDSAVVALLGRMADSARRGIIINDLERSAPNRALVWLGAHLLSRSPIVHRDSDRSVCAAFSRAEISQLAQAAGLRDFRIERRFPCRLQLIWTKTA